MISSSSASETAATFFFVAENFVARVAVFLAEGLVLAAGVNVLGTVSSAIISSKSMCIRTTAICGH